MGLRGPQKDNFLAILGIIWPYVVLAAPFGLDTGKQGRTFYLTYRGTRFTLLDPSIMVPGGWGGPRSWGKGKAVCCVQGHCSLLPKSERNAVYLPPNAIYWLQGSFLRSSLLPLLSFAARPPFIEHLLTVRSEVF